MSGVSRRDFLKVAGTSAGAIVAASYNRRSYAANSRIRVGVIGTGGQGGKHIEYGIPDTPSLQLVAICDVYRYHREFAAKMIEMYYSEDDARAVSLYGGDYREMLDKEHLDAVVISTPPDLHHGMVMESLDRGLAVFCEKPLALTVEHAREIVIKCHETGGFCQVGHQRRYNPVYNKAVWIARHTPYVGRINHVTAQRHRNDDWRRHVDPNYKLDATEAQFIRNIDEHVNWRLYARRSGGLITELGASQMDTATWFLGTPPSRVSGFGGIDYWLDGRDVEDNISVVFEYDVPRSAKSFQPAMPRTEHQNRSLLTRPYRVRVDYSSITANSRRGASEMIHGDHGSLELSAYVGSRLYAERGPLADVARLAQSRQPPVAQSGMVVARQSQADEEIFRGGTPIQIYDESIAEGFLHLDQRLLDTVQFQAFAKDILEGGTPKANAYVGLLATATTVAANQAVRERRIVEIDPAWLAFDFEVPDPYRYDDYPSPEISECPLQYRLPEISRGS